MTTPDQAHANASAAPRVDYQTLLDASAAFFVRAGASDMVAKSAARAIVDAEAEGNTICGFFYLPVLAEQISSGRADGHAIPAVARESAASAMIDAKDGLAQPALDLARTVVRDKARACGTASVGIFNSANALSLGSITGPLADEGLVALAFANAPGSVAAPGSMLKLYGTNPISLAAPVPGRPPIIIDQSASAVSKTLILQHLERGEPLGDGWAQGPDGQPTTDPAAGHAGVMLPSGGIKGANIAMMVEILAAVLTGATLSQCAPGLMGTDGPSPKIGQFIIAMDPEHFGGAAVAANMTKLVDTIVADPALRLPGGRRAENKRLALRDGLDVSSDVRVLLGL